MAADAEAEVLGVAIDPEAVGLVELECVAIRRGIEQKHILPLLHRHSLVHEILRQCTGEGLHRRHHPHHLLDGGRNQRRVVDELSALLGILDQQLHPSRHAVAGRLVAGDQEQHHEHDQLVVGHLLFAAVQNLVLRVLDFELREEAFVLGTHQDAHEIVLGGLAPILDDLTHVGGVLQEGGRRLRHDLRIVVVSVRGDQSIRPLVESLAILLMDSDHLRDDQEGERDRKIQDEVALALLHHRVDALLRDVAEDRLELLDHPRGEAPIDEAA